MLGKVVVVAGAGAVAWLLRTRKGPEAGAGSPARLRLPQGRDRGTVPALVDRRPQALEDGSRTVPALLPDATATEIAGAVARGEAGPR